MSNEEDRKSMDDVLASIRRIVRSEKEPEAPVGPPSDVAGSQPESPVTPADAAQSAAPQDDAAPNVGEPMAAPQTEHMPGTADETGTAAEPETPPSDPAYEPGREPTLVPSAGLTPGTEPASAAHPQDDPVDAPLALTSDMRLDEAEASEGSTLSQAMDAAASDARSMPDAPVPDAGLAVGSVAAAASSVLGGDAEALKDMVRTVIREELTSSDTAGEAIRSIIRDELMTGEIGQNISQNVLALIQAEVSKATGQ